MFGLYVLSSLFLSTYAQTSCSDGGIGPASLCPPPNIVTGDGNCCTPDKVLTTGGGAVTSTFAPGVTTSFIGFNTFGTTSFGGIGRGFTASGNCVDLLNPRTGVSDCPARRNLCNDATYYDVMTQQCPQTCGRCSNVNGVNGGNTAGGCVDRINPKTGQSDCLAHANLCNDATYYTVMTQQCPRTCGRCNGSGVTAAGGFTVNQGFTSTVNSLLGNCADQVNPRTHISDCPSLRSFCTNSAYRDLMRIQCPATCGFCGASGTATTINGFTFNG